MTVLATFRSDMRPLMRLLTHLCLWGTAACLIAVLIVQVRANRLGAYTDLWLLLLAPCANLAGGLAFYIMVRLFPVQIVAGGLRCYDRRGRYHIVRWSDINHVQLARFHDLPYLLVGSPRIPQPITLPLWLQDMGRFVDMAEREGGADNMLVAALRDAT